jgi:hypothetical protein
MKRHANIGQGAHVFAGGECVLVDLDAAMINKNATEPGTTEG